MLAFAKQLITQSMLTGSWRKIILKLIVFYTTIT